MRAVKPKTLCTVDLRGAPEARRDLESCCDLICIEPVREKILPLLHDVDVYFASAAVEVDLEFLDAAPRLKLVASPSTGTDHLDLENMERRGITVFDIATEYELLEQFSATSELAFGLILNLVRHIIPAHQSAVSGIWARENFSGYQLLGKTIGILGLGRLGKITAKIALGFGMRVLACDKSPKSMKQVKNVTFDELMSESDILSIHVHLNEETTGIIDKRALGIMKPTALLINTSRGKIIDEKALLEALTNKTISGAGLDVVDGEWLSNQELISHPLIEYSRCNNNLVIVPHIGGSTFESINLARVFMAKKIKEHVCNHQIITTM